MSHGTERAAGVCILKCRFNGKILISDCDKNGHYIFLILEAAQSFYILVNVYGFNYQTENNIFFDKLEERLLYWLSKYPDYFIIFGGDFNTVLDNSMVWLIPGGTRIQLKEHRLGAIRHRPVTRASTIGLFQKI